MLNYVLKIAVDKETFQFIINILIHNFYSIHVK